MSKRISRMSKEHLYKNVVRPMQNLKSEYEASKWAYDTMKRKSGQKAAKKMMRTLLPAYGSYAAQAAGIVAAGAATYNTARALNETYKEGKEWKIKKKCKIHKGQG